MNIDEALQIGEASVAAKQQLLIEALDSDDPQELRDAIRDVQNAPELLTEPFLDLLGRLTPALADDGNIPSLAIYFLAAWREPRALEPLVRYFEEGGAEADEALGDIVVQDLSSILRSIVAGRFDVVRRLAENEAADEWVRGMAIRTLVSAAVAGELPVEEVETYLQDLMTTRLARDGSFVWTQLASAATDLASQQLLPYVEQAYADGLIEEAFMTLGEVREGVHGGRERAFARFRKDRTSRLIDDVVEATSWWRLFSERRPSDGAEEREHTLVHPGDFPRFPRDEPVIRATPQNRPQRSLPLRQREKVQEVLRRVKEERYAGRPSLWRDPTRRPRPPTPSSPGPLGHSPDRRLIGRFKRKHPPCRRQRRTSYGE